MLAIEAGGLIDELEDALKSGASERRIEMLRRVTDLFLIEAPKLSQDQTAVFDDVIERLADKVEVRFRRELAERLSIASNAPINVTRKLACDEIAIARSILVNSMRLDDDDLAEIAAQASQDHLLAISERETLSEQVTDVLVTRGDQKVVHSLAGNGGARFSGYGFKTLVERADGDETLQEKIGSRSDLPQPLLKSLMRIASERVRQRLIAKREPTEQPDRFSRMVEEVAAPTPKRPLDYALADAAIDDLQRAGQLNEEGVARLVAAQRDCQVIAALSRLASLPAPTIESLWTPEQSQGLVMLTKALGFSARTTREIARLAMADWGTADALDEVMRNFDRLSLTTAQRIVRFWKVRSTAQAEVERKTGDVHFVPA